MESEPLSLSFLSVPLLSPSLAGLGKPSLASGQNGGVQPSGQTPES